MCLNAVITYTQYLGIEACKFLNILLEGQQFPFSDRSEISKVKGKHHIFIAAIIKQIDRSVGERFRRTSVRQAGSRQGARQGRPWRVR